MSSIIHTGGARSFGPTRLATILARMVLRVLAWPGRVMQARRDLALLASLNAHELRDIGLTRADIANATALPLDADPTEFLAAALPLPAFLKLRPWRSQGECATAASMTVAAALIYKILPLALWREAQASGHFTGAPVDVADGFIHFSTAGQMRETAARHFAGQQGLVLLAVDAAQLGTALKWEVSRGGALFPHLYGDLPVAAIVSAHPLPCLADGSHDFDGAVA